MSFLQRDLSNMPPEAIAEARSQFDELFGSDFAHSSRNNQNPGSALLNWLFGSSSNNESDNWFVGPTLFTSSAWGIAGGIFSVSPCYFVHCIYYRQKKNFINNCWEFLIIIPILHKENSLNQWNFPSFFLHRLKSTWKQLHSHAKPIALWSRCIPGN